MIEDKLDTNQRIRLEALAQSVAFAIHTVGNEQATNTVARAKEFENFIRYGTKIGKEGGKIQ